MKKHFYNLRKVYFSTLLMLITGISFAQNFTHPGMLHTEGDFTRIREKLDKNSNLWVKEYAVLKGSEYARLGRNPIAVEILKRGVSGDENYMNACRDLAAAYQSALIWKISGDTRYADQAVNILNAWATTCKQVTGNTNMSLASGLYGYQFANVAELMRDYEGWPQEEFKQFQQFMLDVFYPVCVDFLVRRHDTNHSKTHYWANWGLANVLAVVSIGILCDDTYIYNQGMDYFKYGDYTEAINNLVVKVWPDTDYATKGPYGYLGQLQESNRDQGHAILATGLAACVCEIAWNQGEDVYAYYDNRLAATFEYVAAYNAGVDDLPNQTYVRQPGNGKEEPYSQMGAGGRGGTTPWWAKIYYHYAGRKGINNYMRSSNIKKMYDAMNSGGGGQNGVNSGGFDGLGFGRLMFSRDLVGIKTPTSITPLMKYNGQDIHRAELSAVEPGNTIELCPQLEEGATDTGKWLWNTGKTTREITVSTDKSGFYRVVYTNAEGTSTSQYFSIAVTGDCRPTTLKPQIVVGDATVYSDSVAIAAPGSTIRLSLSAAIGDRYGSYLWDNGKTTSSQMIQNVQENITRTGSFTNLGGAKSSVNFKVTISEVIPRIKVDDGNYQQINEVTVPAGSRVELSSAYTPTTGGNYLWSDGSTGANLVIENIQESKVYTLTFTNAGNKKYTGTFRINVYTKNTLSDGNYYIINPANGQYLTNSGGTAPVFTSKSDDVSAAMSQGWSIMRDGARYKITSLQDNRYLNEYAVFGTNSYYTEWNSVEIYHETANDWFAFQNGDKAGTHFWGINGNSVVGKYSEQYYGFPFKLTEMGGSAIDELSENKFSIYPTITNDFIFMSIPEGKQAAFSLHDMNGRQLFCQDKVCNGSSIDISKLSNGIYVGIIVSENICKQTKVIKR